MKTPRQLVLALGDVGVDLVLVRRVTEALIQAALDQEQPADPIPGDLKVRSMWKHLPVAIVMISPDVLDLELTSLAL